MTERKCPNCGSAEIYQREKGVIAHGYGLKIDLDDTNNTQDAALDARVCGRCGRVEFYLHDLSLLPELKTNKNWTPPGPVVCQSCGKLSPADARFCDKCGAKLNE